VAAAALATTVIVKLALGSLFTRLRASRLLQHELRARVHEAVAAEPGIHYSGLVRRTSLAKGTLDHHLRKLVDAGLVHRREAKGIVCFFTNPPDAGAAETASATRSALARSLLNAIALHPDMTAKELAQRFGIHASSVCHHVHRLGEAGLLQRQRQGKSFTLRLTERGTGFVRSA
jgi:predicted transcriptional regulator